MSRTTTRRSASSGGDGGDGGGGGGVRDARLERLGVEAYCDVVRVALDDASIPPIDARFYPYAGVQSTIRLREGRVFLRVSDLLADAPAAALGALARILVAKLLRRRVRKAWDEAYRAHVRGDAVAAASEAARAERGRKRVAPARGAVYDLDLIFDELNTAYFDGALQKPRLGWSLRDGWRTHGHWDSAHKTIALNRTLDAATTPRLVVEYVLYHEMLHARMGAELRDGRRCHHTRAFREAEARFPRMDEAVTWLENFSNPNGTKSNRKRSRQRR